MDIYQYEDYRLFLKDLLEKEKAEPSFSCRKFAAKAGFSNPNFINDVIKGRRRLSVLALEKISAVFSLAPHEADFLRLLVQYHHAKKLENKDALYRKIVFRRTRSAFAKINPELSRYYQDFRYSLIRNAIMTLDFYGDAEMLSGFLVPSIPPNVVKKLLKDLVDWNIVKIEDSGKYIVTNRFIEPSPKLTAQVRQTNKEWLKQAEEALMSLSVDERHISSMLLSVSAQLREEIHRKIEGFRNEIWDMVKRSTEDPDCIMLLNLQYIPKSKNRKDT